MIIEKIEALRKEPREVRNRYAFGTALSVTLVIAAVWAVSLPSRLTLENVATSEVTDPDAPSLQNQLSELRNFMGDSLADIKSQAELIETAAEVELATTTATTSAPTPVFLLENVRLAATTSTTTATSTATSSVR